jgi:hypothetical protein
MLKRTRPILHRFKRAVPWLEVQYSGIFGYYLGVCAGNGTAGDFVKNFKGSITAEVGWNHDINYRPDIPFGISGFLVQEGR